MAIGTDDGQYHEDGMSMRMAQTDFASDEVKGKAKAISVRPVEGDPQGNPDVEDRRGDPLGLSLYDVFRQKLSNVNADVSAGIQHPLTHQAPLAVRSNLEENPPKETELGDQLGYSDIRQGLGSPTSPADVSKLTEGNPPPAKAPGLSMVGAISDFAKRTGSELSTALSSLKGVTNPSFEEDKNLLSGFYNTVKNAFKLPGDVYGGKIDPMSEQGIQRANDLAGLMVFGPMPVAQKMADGTLGSFAGVRALHTNNPERAEGLKSLTKAQDMSDAGVHTDQIWHETGWFKGADGRWKYEISPEGAKFKPGALKLDANQDPMRVAEGKEKAKFIVEAKKLKDRPTLGDMYDHPELYKAYPALKDLHVIPVNGFGQAMGVRGFYDPENSVIALSGGTKASMHSTLLHEIQHAIQHMEGFSTGGNKAAFETARWKELASEHAKLKAETEKKVFDHYTEVNAKGPPLAENEWNKSPFMRTLAMKEAVKSEDFLQGTWSNDKKWKNFHYFDEERFNEGKEALQTAKDLGVYDDMKKIVEGDRIKDKYDDLAFETYRRIKGETEARNVQTRQDIDPTTRATWSPLRSQDYPNADQIWSPFDPQSLKDLQ